MTPTITSANTFSIAENTSVVTTITAIDADSNNLVYSLDGGADVALFSINAATGALSFITPPDFEAPSNAALTNAYQVIVKASDGVLSSTQAITVNVSNVNEAPIITSNGGLATAAISFAENSAAAVTTVIASDLDANSQLTYSLAGGADAASFTIDQLTGLLRFIASPNFEAPTDAGSNNIYDVNVKVSDGLLFDTQSLAISVANVNEAPVITSYAGANAVSLSFAENSTALAATITASDVDANSVISYSLAGGADAAKFNINSTTGALSFITPPNFESPTDAVPTNSYQVLVQASDGALSDTQAFTINVTNVDEAATGSLHIIGYAKPDATSVSFTALNTIADPDTMSNVVQYQWQVNNPVFPNGARVDVWTDIAGANSAVFTSNLGGVYRVTSSYTDTFGTYHATSTNNALIMTDLGTFGDLGTAGDDYQIVTETGYNYFVSSSGNDTIVGSASRTQVGGNSYNDQFSADAIINLSTGIATSLDAGTDVLLNIQSVRAGSGNDYITGNLFDNLIYGNSGDDTIEGGGGLDNLNGGVGEDVLTGGLGDDNLDGGLGADVLTGGLGADKFIYFKTSALLHTGVGVGNRDVITDFKYEGADRILFFFDANSGTGSQDLFIFNATAGAAFTAAGQLHYHYEGTGANEITIIQGNIDANLAPDFEIELTGHVTLTAADFVF